MRAYAFRADSTVAEDQGSRHNASNEKFPQTCYHINVPLIEGVLWR